MDKNTLNLNNKNNDNNMNLYAGNNISAALISVNMGSLYMWGSSQIGKLGLGDINNDDNSLTSKGN